MYSSVAIHAPTPISAFIAGHSTVQSVGLRIKTSLTLQSTWFRSTPTGCFENKIRYWIPFFASIFSIDSFKRILNSISQTAMFFQVTSRAHSIENICSCSTIELSTLKASFYKDLLVVFSSFKNTLRRNIHKLFLFSLQHSLSISVLSILEVSNMFSFLSLEYYVEYERNCQ